MSRLLDPPELLPAAGTRPPADPGNLPITPSVVSALALQQELADLRREVASLRVQRQRDIATARGLGEALQALRRGAMAMRAENEELRRAAADRARRR